MGSLLSSEAVTNASSPAGSSGSALAPEVSYNPSAADPHQSRTSYQLDGGGSSNNNPFDGQSDGSTIMNTTAPETSTNLTSLVDVSTFAPQNSTATLNSNSTTSDFKFNLFGTDYYPFQWITLPILYSWLGPLSSFAMIVGCVIPYVPQYVTIYKNRNCGGFSTFVCLALLLANIMRVIFWFGHHFELPLLVQSAIVIMGMILLLELCVRVKNSNAGTNLKKRSLFTSNPIKCFWRWTDLTSYIEFLCLFSAALGVAMFVLIDCEPFVETIGYLALVTESMLGLPQVIKNYRRKSVEGMSLNMVLLWFGGDSFKTGYFIANHVPYQFWLCGLIQISIDLIIMIQVCVYRGRAPMKLHVDDASKEMTAL